MKIIAIIPARLESSRLPQKLLKKLGSITILEHVYKRVLGSGLFFQVIIATDSQKIYDAVENFGGIVMMTSPLHQSGTDRVAEIAKNFICDAVVNVQGDEPFISKDALTLLVDAMHNKHINYASLMHHLDPSTVTDPNNVKVVVNSAHEALYFSRALIPYDRDKKGDIPYYGHIGVYAYQKQALLDFVNMGTSHLEAIEKLEQLRILENGEKIKMCLTDYTGFGIDTPADLEKARAIIAKHTEC